MTSFTDRPDLQALSTLAGGGQGQIIGHLDGPVLPRPHWQVAEQRRIAAGAPLPMDRRGLGPRARHGTQMAGLLAEIAPAAGLVLGEVLGRGALLARIALGLDWLIARDPAPGVICLPLGLPGACAVLDDLQKAAQARDILLVAAIGNRGANTGLAPARFPGVLAVGAVQPPNAAASYSGSLPDATGEIARKPEIVADGVLASGSALGARGGTSAACARVAAVASLLRAAYPDKTARQVFGAFAGGASAPDPGARHRVRHGILEIAATEALLREGAVPCFPTPDAVSALPWALPRETEQAHQTVILGFADRIGCALFEKTAKTVRGDDALTVEPFLCVPALMVSGPAGPLRRIAELAPPIYVENAQASPVWAATEP